MTLSCADLDWEAGAKPPGSSTVAPARACAISTRGHAHGAWDPAQSLFCNQSDLLPPHFRRGVLATEDATTDCRTASGSGFSCRVSERIRY